VLLSILVSAAEEKLVLKLSRLGVEAVSLQNYLFVGASTV
jgi:hypothetical protein